MKFAPPLAGILSMVFLTGTAFAQLSGEAKTSVLSGAPSETPEVASYRSEDKDGMRWYWTPEGRRDMGQFFHVEKAFTAERLVLQINSGTAKPPILAPFRLTFARPTSKGIGPGEIVAVREGKLPGRGEVLRKGAWLSITFDPVPFEPGDYCFLLQFLAEGEGNAVTFNVGPANAYAGGQGFQSLAKDAAKYAVGTTLNFLLFSSQPNTGTTSVPAVQAANPSVAAPVSSRAPGRILEVDQRGGTPYATIAAAASEVLPGDTIRLAKGSGPYREIVRISRSGEVGRPVVFDGNGEVVTGFEPLQFKKEGKRWTCDLTAFFAGLKYVQGFEKKESMWVNNAQSLAFPGVLTFRGKRLFQDAVNGQFLPLATLVEGGRKLILEPGVEADGWEISSRDMVFCILNVSHHIYRNTRASGSLNDGYNLHGTGTDLVFENIEGFHNLDEGFSAHDKIECTLRKGRFWENDNGLCNVASCSMEASDIETFANSGWGFALLNCRGELNNVRSWDNGLLQVAFISAAVTCRNVVAVKPSWDKRKWITSQESKRDISIVTYQKSAATTISGEVIVEEPNSPTSMLSK